LGADDSVETRIIEAQRYAATTPADELFANATESMAMNLPPDQRPRYRALMNKHLDVDRLTQVMIDAMVRHFTTDELSALADFYGSKEGKSAMAKFGPYMADVMPIIQAEMLKAQAKAVEADAKANRQLPDDQD
jgi:hypothetical protein